MKTLKALVLLATTLYMPAYAGMGCGFDTFIDRSDLYSSKGVKLTSVGQIIRQDRANFYAGIGNGVADDCMFDNAENRKELQRMIDKSKISNATKNRIKRGNVNISVYITDGRHVDIEIN